MTTQQQIDDPEQWRAGDDVRIEWPNGSVLTGKAQRYGASLMVQVAGTGGYSLDYDDGRKVTVTRKVEPIPEPTEPWALVRFADGEVVWLAAAVDRVQVWADPEGSLWGWADAIDEHGAPVAVSLPRWSDEAEGGVA